MATVTRMTTRNVIALEHSNKKPDAVIISNPTSMHYKYLISLLDKNINVLVEKPIVSSEDQLKNQFKKQLPFYSGIGMTAHTICAFIPASAKCQEIISENKIGKRSFPARFLLRIPEWRPKQNYSVLIRLVRTEVVF